MPERNIDEQVKETRRLFWLFYEDKLTLAGLQEHLKEIWDRQLSINDIEKEKIEAC